MADAQTADQKKAQELRERIARQRAKREAEFLLTAKALEKGIHPWVPDLDECYRKHALKQKKAAGTMHLELLVDPDGKVKKIRVVAKGVRGKRLDRCVRAIANKMRFEERRGYTRATVPFRYLSSSKRAGPLESCWSRRGCPTPNKRPAKVDKKKGDAAAAKKAKKSDNKAKKSDDKAKKSDDKAKKKPAKKANKGNGK